MSSDQTLYTNLKKSKSDKRNYTLKILKNGMKCLLISDPETTKSAASMVVNIGSLLDPKEYQGLAHFCEHMLFMGTKKYPLENEYYEFLAKNSGDSNAYTSNDITNYYYYVSNEAFEESLDRFSQFFISSLFSENSVNKEINAVDSEHKKNVNNDLWRFYQLLASESKENSFFNKFSTGNLETLKKDDIREKLIEFYKKYYTSEMMGLCVYSNKNSDELINLVEKYFSDVYKIENYQKPFYGEILPFDKDNLQYFYKVTPIKDKDEIKIYWILDDDSKYYKNKPLSMLANLFGHEGPNTLISSLSKDDLIDSFLVGSTNYAKVYSIFYFKIILTPKGLKYYKDVILRCFKYIKIIQSKPINKRFINEYIKKNHIEFDYKNQKTPLKTCTSYTSCFFSYNNEDILTGEYLIEEFNEEITEKYLKDLKQENCLIFLYSKEIEKECNLTEKWYGTKYTKEKFTYTDEEIDKVECKHPLDYPPENLFFPENLDLLKEPDEIIKYPQKIFSNEKCRIWYKQDLSYKRPKAYMQLEIMLEKNVAKNDNVKNVILSQISEEIIKNELREICYMAEEALIEFSISITSNIILIIMKGFNSSMKNAFKLILEELIKIDFSNKSEQFKIGLNNLMKKKTNFYYSTNYSVCKNYIDYVMKTPSISPIEQLEYLNDNELTINDLINFSKNLYNNCKIEWIIQGNLLKEEALEINNIVCNTLKININDNNIGNYQDIRAVNISEKTNYIYQFYSPIKEEISSSILSFYQCGHLSEFEKVILNVIQQCLKDRFFDDLRTNQTLAYVALLYSKSIRGNYGLICLIQSNVKEPEYVSSRIRDFINQQLEFFQNISENELKEFINAVEITLKKPFINLEEEVKFNGTEVVQHTYMFDKKEIQLNELKKVNKENLIKFYQEHFIDNVKKIDIEFVASIHKESNNKILNETQINGIKRISVDSIEKFYAFNSLFPDFYSKNIY